MDRAEFARPIGDLRPAKARLAARLRVHDFGMGARDAAAALAALGPCWRRESEGAVCEIELAYADPAQAERFIAEVWVLLEETASIPSPKVSAKGAGSALALTFEQRAYAESVFGRLLRNYPAMKLAADERQSGKTHQWRAWADELRATADQLTHPSAREALLRAAANYDRLADRDEGKPSDAQRPENKRTG